jgi:hypothetical protein
MTDLHLSDETIQQLIWDEALPDASAVGHMSTCDYCKARASNYQLLFKKIEQMPAAAFGFDLAQLVLNELAQPLPKEMSPVLLNDVSVESARPGTPEQFQWRKKRTTYWAAILTTVVSICVITAPLYFMDNYLQDLLGGISTILTSLIIITIILILGFLIYDEYHKYTKQINSLDL